MLTLSVRGLAGSATESSVTELFSQYGSVHSVKLVKDLFTGKCRGFAQVRMEGHEARNAISALNHTDVDGSILRVEVEKKDSRGNRKRR